MSSTRHRSKLLLHSAVVAAITPAALAQVVFNDDMNRSLFSASQNGWIVQGYAKDKGTFGLVPTSVFGNTAFRYAVTSNTNGVINMTNTITSSSFAPPTAGQYMEFATRVQLDSAAAATPGLVFGISAYGKDAANHEYATNFEFVTKQLNLGTSSTPYDRLALTSFNNYSATSGGVWSAYVESGANATSGFHTYTMRIFTGKVDYLVDDNLIASTTSNVPVGTNLAFELNGFAPDSGWASAEAPLPKNAAWYLYTDWAKVSYGAVTMTNWTGASTTDPLIIKQSANWRDGIPATGIQGVIDDSATVPATLYFGNADTVGISQTLGALSIDSTKLTALNANAGAAPASSTTYSVALVGNTGNTVPVLSLGSNVTQSVSISDTSNAILNLQLGVGSAGINVTNAGATLTINSKVINKGGVTASLVKTGAGMLVLTNTGNSFGGAGQTVQISGGTLSIDANTQLGSASNTVTLDGGTLRINPASSLTLARSVIVSSNGGGISTPTSSVTLSSPLGGSGTLAKSGAAELIVNSAAGTFNGTINVSQGNLRIINPGSTAAGTTVRLMGTNSTLNLRADTDNTYNANIEATSAPAQIFVANQNSGASSHTLSVGSILLGGPTLSVGGSSGYAVGASQLVLSGNGTIATNTAGLSIAGGVIETGGSRSLTKAGSGNLTIAGSSSYSGNTTVLAGGLTLVGAGASAPILSGTGITDVQHGRVSFDYRGASTPAAAVRSAIISGQIRDSIAAANIALGYLDDPAVSIVSVMPTYLGDADLNGVVDSSDFAMLASHFHESGANIDWSSGDFNYDGVVNALDFNLLATNYGQALPADAVAAEATASLRATLVPEPFTGLAVAAALLFLRPRLRRAV